MRTSAQRTFWHELFAFALGLLIIFPIFHGFMSAFKTDGAIDAYPPRLLPESFLYLENFIQAIFHSMVPRYMLNSLFIAVTVTLVRLIISSTAAYAFAFMNFKGKNVLFFYIIGTMMIPPEALLISNYLTISRLGLIDTYLGVMAVYFVSATQVFMLRQNFKTVSKSLREAAFLDGCTDLKFYVNICIPISVPVFTSLGISSFIHVWNAYLWPLLVTNDDAMRTVQVGISLLSSPDAPVKGPVFAAVALSLLPAVVIFAISQRSIVQGISSGAVKG